MLDFHIKKQRQYSSDSEERIHVVLKLNEDFAEGEDLQFQETSRAGMIVAGTIPRNRLTRLEASKSVDLIECHRPFKDELDDSIIGVNLVDHDDKRQIPSRGKGALIGIIDSSFELTHPNFRDSNDKTRIVAAWDQVNLPQIGNNEPKDFGYGFEYSRETIDANIRNKATVVIKNSLTAISHGNDVASIAAGNGTKDEIFQGMAPEAELILVTYKNDEEIGGSAFVLDAIQYILNYAKKLGRPVVINISQGDNLGAHDGSSLLELAIDYWLDKHDDLLIVNSAGNCRADAQHASGQVKRGEAFSIKFDLNIPKTPVDSDVVDLWYSGDDELTLAIQIDDFQSDLVEPGTEKVIAFPFGTRANVFSELNYPTNGLNRISVVFEKGDGWKKGNWALILTSRKFGDGLFHVWADRPNGASTITFNEPSEACTVTLPGTAEKIITVASFASRPANIFGSKVRGALWPISSAGPTRNSHTKPDIAAPGATIIVPTLTPKDGSAPAFRHVTGTSMAAPHVSGIIALLWALNPSLSGAWIRSKLYETASKDDFTGPTPNNDWGSGKIDAGALYKSLFQTTKKENITMSQNCSLNLILPVEGEENGIPVTLTISVGENGDISELTATADGFDVEASLHLRLVGRGAEGGDECRICTSSGCQVVDC